ncbi:MAG: N-acetylmuramoyl-L-alanine amidase [Chlorobi bacterium]|nr:N-acetylmuramoyl-L-alanine amidase [Chlorobiota bacterium]
MDFLNVHITRLKYFILSLTISLFTVIGYSQGSYKEVVAQKGDGVYVLLRRHGLSPSEYFKSFITLNKDGLGKNNTLISGRKYKLPNGAASPGAVSKGSTITYPIFGKKYENVPITSSELKGAVYYLVSGHGGPDPGAMSIYSNKELCEDEYAYDVTLRLARNLIEKGATVYMITRDPNDGIRDESFLKPDKDELCYPGQTIPLNQMKRLRQRKDAVNKLYVKHKGHYQRMIAIHVDSRSRGENIDVFFYHDKRSNAGKECARNIQKVFQQKYRQHQPSRGYKGTVSSRNLYVVKNTYPVAVYIELGNINHRRDQQRFIITDNRQAVSNWLTEGLVKDYKDRRK